MKSKILLIALLAIALLSGCATPLGQQYGAVGGLGGAAIGAAAGGLPGAVIGGAAGAAAGGLLGDHESFNRRPPYREGYGPEGEYYDRQPYCQLVPVYDNLGYVVGRRQVCR